MTDTICTRCGRNGHRASHCPWPAFLLLQPCMGGFCAKSDDCPHYHSERLAEPSERLCLPGQDGVQEDSQIIIHKPPGTWERSGAALMGRAGPFDMVLPV